MIRRFFFGHHKCASQYSRELNRRLELGSCYYSKFLQEKVTITEDLVSSNQQSNPNRPKEATWQTCFTPKITEVFKERYGQLLIDLGYE